MLRLLLTGIPGTGKTTLGRHLERHHGFAHVDLEDEATAGQLLRRLEAGDREAAIDACAGALATSSTGGRHLVVRARDAPRDGAAPA